MRAMQHIPETYQVRVHGQVQGVGFRQATVRKAHALGIHGWVRNLDDGTVEALVQGVPDQVDEMLQWLRFGPPLAKVTALDTQRIDTDRRYEHFARR
ncbi:MAG: Acylphosphatase [Saezia sanguinis]